MVRRACAVDANQGEIVDVLRQLGWDVIDMHGAAQYVPGFPDLIAARGGEVLLIEVKVGREKLTPDEADFWAAHSAYLPLRVVRTAEDVIALSGGRMM